MADLALVQNPETLRWDFPVVRGDIPRTTEPWPAILRLLSQGSWIGDDGERAGDCLNDVTINDQGTKDRVTRIAQSRLGALIKTGQISSVQAVQVTVVDTRVVAQIQVVIPGQQPKSVQVPLTR